MCEKNNSNLTILSKDTKDTLDLGELEKCIIFFKANSHVFIKGANKEQREKQKFFIECLKKATNQTSKLYIYKMVQDGFKELTEVTPGTFGAYFKGCFISTNFENGACTPACVASFVPEGLPGCIECETLSVLLEKNGTYNVLNEKRQKVKKCYIFVKKEHNIRTINRKLFHFLKNRGILEYNIVLFEGNVFENLYANFVPLEEVQDSSSVSTDKKNCKSAATACWIIFGVVILILVILVLLALGLFFYKKKDY